MHDEVVPHEVFHFGFTVEHHVITFDLGSPKGNVTKWMPKHGFLGELARNPLHKEGLFLVEVIIVVPVNSTKVMHDINCPLPCFTS